METQNNVNASPTVSGQPLCRISFNRTDEATKISVKSPIAWKFMRKHGKDNKFVLANVTCFVPRSNNLEGINSNFSTEQIYESGGYPNLSMLLAENIQQGVEFVFPPLPFPDSKLDLWAARFKEEVKALYFMYVKPKEVTIEITSSIVEKEVFN